MIHGTGVFAKLGVDVFDDYWMNYRTRAMAREEGFEEPPYTNLKTYQTYKKYGAAIINMPEAEIESESDDIDEDDLINDNGSVDDDQ